MRYDVIERVLIKRNLQNFFQFSLSLLHKSDKIYIILSLHFSVRLSKKNITAKYSQNA